MAWITLGHGRRRESSLSLWATVYELEKLQCHLCVDVYTAETPEGIGDKKYDETAVSMTAVMRYGNGFPWERLKNLEQSLSSPWQKSMNRSNRSGRYPCCPVKSAIYEGAAAPVERFSAFCHRLLGIPCRRPRNGELLVAAAMVLQTILLEHIRQAG